MAAERKGKEYPVDLFDAEQYRRYAIKNKRLEMAYAAVLAGIGSVRFCKELRAHAEATNDSHKMWQITVHRARQILEMARQEMAKDMAKNRASALAAQLQRLEYLYSKAIKDGKDELALSILKEITAMHDRVGTNEREEKTETVRRDKSISHAVKKLAESISRHTQGGIGGAVKTEPDAS